MMSWSLAPCSHPWPEQLDQQGCASGGLDAKRTSSMAEMVAAVGKGIHHGNHAEIVERSFNSPTEVCRKPTQARSGRQTGQCR